MSEDTDQDLACAGIDIGKDVQQENMTPTPEMPMTPEERALDILDDIVEAESWPQKKRDLFIQGCAAQIREVEEIAADRNYKEPDQARWFRHGFKEGFNAAKEKAAQRCVCREDCDRIRKMEAE